MENKDVGIGQQLPLDLGNGLQMRRANINDIDALAAFNIQIHSDDRENPSLWLGEWTRDLMDGKHPTTKATDFTLVVDQNQDGKIVSSLNLISQTWTYAGIPFGVGRVELVGTDPAYRRKGLVRSQMTVIHDLSISKGELVQAITGIPWYYRQFGYEMAINLGGGRNLIWDWSENKKSDLTEKFRVRKAEEKDIAILCDLYAIHNAESLIQLKKDPQLWKYGMFEAHRDTPAGLRCQVIENMEKKVVGYADVRQWGTGFNIQEMGVSDGASWREVGLYLADWLKNEAIKLNSERDDPITNIHFNLGETHPIYRALRDKLHKKNNPYAWYIRVPDLCLFLEHIGQVLEDRLANSVLAGYSGSLRLNFYRDALSIVFEEGQLRKVDGYKPTKWEDADALFPDFTFLKLLFGYRSFEELDYERADCYAPKDETSILLDILFPRCPSDISPQH